MLPEPENASVVVKSEEIDAFTASSPPSHGHHDSVEEAFSSDNGLQSAAEEDGNDIPSNANAIENALVVYDPAANGGVEIVPVPEPIDIRPQVGIQHYNIVSRVLPSVGAFTVQCATCFKWRLIPTKEKYEEIREFISENPFYCETAREWRPDISCDDPADLQQDGSRLWAIDKPNIAQPPPGWQRLLRIRAEGGSKFADVYWQPELALHKAHLVVRHLSSSFDEFIYRYYVAPSGKRLRSMVEIQKYLCQYPEYATEDVQPSQFSFQIPRPLQENYVRKRPARLMSGDDCNHLDMPMLLGPSEGNPLAWAGPEEITELQLGGPGLSSTPYFEAPVFDPISRPAKNQARRATPFLNRHTVTLEYPDRSINDDYDV